MSDGSSGPAVEQGIEAHRTGDFATAERVYTAVLERQPDHAPALNAFGILRLQQGRVEEACTLFRQAIRTAPREAKHHSNLGNALMALGTAEPAVEAFAQAVELAPLNVEFQANLATAEMAAGWSERAVEDFARALALRPDHLRSLTNLGALLSKLNRLDEALGYLEQAAAQPEPGAEALLNLASVCERLNRTEAAAQALDRLSPDEAPYAAVLRARLLRRAGEPARALEVLDAGRPGLQANGSAEQLGDWQHEAGRCADLASDAGRAFAAFLEAKRHWRRADGGRDGAAYLERVRRLRAEPAREVIGDAPAVQDGVSLTFFVGFPRSGTTLMELMLGVHPAVLTTAEAEVLRGVIDYAGAMPADARIDAIRRTEARRRYLSALAQWVGPAGPGTTVIDKLPLNIVHCRLIDALLPDARLLVALRDPRDVVLSCLMQRFARNDAMRNFDSLEETVALYEQVMGLWLEARGTLHLPVLEYRYEELAAEPEPVLRRILDFLGLDWHDGLLDVAARGRGRAVTTPSYQAVSEPVGERAVGRWRGYAEALAPVSARLAPFVEAFGYEP
ncbi:MAG TPA: sulfotransferase [Alphaproteobacteria bacterium]|nr:sulfotransferase [Alphaproteobacteria bacterium]